MLTRVNKLYHSIYWDSGHPDSTVFLAGTGRSGTTWLEDLINCNLDFRIMFEPFNSYQVPELKNWHHRQYIPSNSTGNRFIETCQKILSGRIKNHWIDKFNNKKWIKKRLIKDIRCHLMLHWLHRQYPDMPIVFLLRHPCAVAASKLNQKNWTSDLTPFLEQEDLITDFLSPYIDEILKAESDFDKHIFLWCIENYVVLKQFQPEQMTMFFYEDILLNPVEQLQRLKDSLKLDIPSDIQEVFKKPSAVTKKQNGVAIEQPTPYSWKSKLTTEQIERSYEICSLFGLQSLYKELGNPNYHASEVLEKIKLHLS